MLTSHGNNNNNNNVNNNNNNNNSAPLLQVNPSYLDRVEDVTLLRFVNESSVLHTLRQRYAGNLIHTSAGFSMLAINSVHPLSIYSDKVGSHGPQNIPF